MLEMLSDDAQDIAGMLDRPFYSPAEVAAIAHISSSTVLNYISEGRLVAVRLSERTIRIPRRSVLRLLAPDSLGGPERVRIDDIPLHAS